MDKIIKRISGIILSAIVLTALIPNISKADINECYNTAGIWCWRIYF